MHRRLIVAMSIAALAGIVPLDAQGHAGPLHIHDLPVTFTGSVSARQVHVRAYVCLSSASEATNVAPASCV